MFQLRSFKLRLILFIVLANFRLLSANDDQKRLDSLLQLTYQSAAIDSFSLAIEYLNDAMDVYEYRGDWENYYKLADQLLVYAKKSGDKTNIAEFNNKLGISSCLNGKNDKALEYFNKALEINQEIGNQQWVSNSLENIGLVYKDMGEYQKALDCQMQSLKIREKVGHPRLAETYSNISVLLEMVGEFDKQYLYIQKAIRVAKTYPDKHELQAIINCELGEYYLDYTDKIDSSILCFQTGLKHCKEVNWTRGIAVFLGDLASAYYAKGDMDKSIDMHLQSLDLSLKINDCMSICEEYNSLTELYIENDQVNSAFKMNQKAIKQAGECKINFELQRAWKNAATIYEKKGNFQQAYIYYKQYHMLSDSLMGIEKHSALVDLETKYETEKKEQQIELLSAENNLKNQRIKTFIALVIILILVISVIVALYMLRQRKARLREDELNQKLLRSQMNPHFIFNALGSIQNYMFKNETKKAAGYLGNFASLTRSILEKSSEELISLEDEITMLQNYIELECMRMNESFSYTVDIDEELETEFISVPPIMIQPFVENAIKHGLKDKKEEGNLVLRIEEKGENIHIEIQDNGPGYVDQGQMKADGHKSMSMQIFNERKQIIEKRIKKQIDLQIDTQNGTKITIMFPLIIKEN